MNPEVAVLLAMMTTVLAVGTPLIVKEFKELRKLHNSMHTRQTVVETKLDILLDHAGFDLHKVNRAIDDNINELNNQRTVGCINLKALYKEE